MEEGPYRCDKGELIGGELQFDLLHGSGVVVERAVLEIMTVNSLSPRTYTKFETNGISKSQTAFKENSNIRDLIRGYRRFRKDSIHAHQIEESSQNCRSIYINTSIPNETT